MNTRTLSCFLLTFFSCWTCQAQTCDATTATSGAGTCKPETDRLDCRDDRDDCSTLEEKGDCTSIEILKSCRKSCFACDNIVKEAQYKSPYGVAQLLPVNNMQNRAVALKHIQNMTNYMMREVYQKDAYTPVRRKCRNLHEYCVQRAALQGYCDLPAQFVYMNVVCAPACFRCDSCLAPTANNDGSSPNQWETARDIDRTFERIMSFDQYKPTAHRLPDNNKFGNGDELNEDDPWIVTLENFMSDREANTLINLGQQKGFQGSRLSADTGSTNLGVETLHRTSSNSFCDGNCDAHPVTKRIMERIQHVTGIPSQNSEHLQLVKYRKGEYYKVHHDCSPIEHEAVQGHRILTFFLYLNNVEEGGETRFPNLNITITSRLGKALVWQNVLRNNVNTQDDRTFHEALPVQGTDNSVKFGANAWIHQRNFQGPYARGCMAVYQP